MEKLYEKIYMDILAKIKNGTLKENDKVPTEHELVEMYNVSRITAKKALDLLVEQNMITRYRGKGSFVRSSISSLSDSQSAPKKGHTIGLIIPDFGEVFGLGLVKAMERTVTEYGCHFLFRRTLGRVEEEKQAIAAMIDEAKVDGLIVFPVHGVHYNNELLKLVGNQFPVVFVDRYIKGIPASSVSLDNREAAIVLTRHLIELGHEKIAFLSPPEYGTSSIEDRILGFHIAVAENGLKLDHHYILNNFYSTMPQYQHSENHWQMKEKEILMIKEFLEKNHEITGMIACEYGIAELIENAVALLNKKIPDDYSVVCFDSPPARDGKHFYTHIQQREKEIGKKAVDLLIDQLKNHLEPKHYNINFELITGQSSREIVRKL